MELIRRILLKIQARETVDPEHLEMDGIDDAVLGRHVELIYKGGLIDAKELDFLGKDYNEYLIRDLTWDGHEFVGAIALDDIWESLKESLAPQDISLLSLEVIRNAAAGAVSSRLREKLRAA